MARRERIRRVSGLALAALAAADLAMAQARASTPSAPSAPVQGRTQVSVSGLWQGGASLGSQGATETQNQRGGGDYALFDTSGRLDSAGGVETRLTVWLTRRIGIEAGGSWSRPQLIARISGDVEGGANTTAVAPLTQYVVDGSALVRLGEMAGGRVVPFVMVGAGALRQIYAGNALIETGTMYHVGGGVLIWLQSPQPGWLKRAGLRSDARWTAHDGGVTIGRAGRRSRAVLGAGLALQF